MESVKGEVEKFRAVLKRSGLTARAFAESIGVTESYVSNILRGERKPSREVLERLALAYEVDLNEYLFGANHPKTIETAYVELFRQEAAAGGGLEVLEYAEREKIAVPRSVIAPYAENDIKAVIVRGDSMNGAHIFDGDFVLFNTRDKEGENIFVVSIGNMLLVKRVVYDSIKKTLTLISENYAYPHRVIKGADLESVFIAGKVIAVIHRVG